MRALRAVILLLTMLVLAAGCTSTHRKRESDGYYSRGRTLHSDAFPPNYVPGGSAGPARFGRY
jgi:hypothetical protein